MSLDLDIRLLRAFIVIAECRSVSRAAVTLGYSQSAMSQQLARIERWAGTTLFDRTHSGMRLNAQGQALHGPAQDIVKILDEFLMSAENGPS